ncbi:MAG: hypothetical protein O2893_05380 [Cyanobacteria bacterium]|nr:hypothetical protein [Cyanobacteriota bacterium]
MRLDQTSLNTQLSASPEDLLAKLKTELTAQGYKERQINTVVGAWGFNLVMEPPGLWPKLQLLLLAA